MTTKQISYRLFAQTLLLLVLYAAASLISGVKFLGADPFAASFPYQQITPFSHVLLNLAIVTGLLGSGLYMVSDENSASALLLWTARGWVLLLVLAILAGIFGLLENRSMLELPPLLDVLQALLSASFIAHIFMANKRPNAVTIVWLVGMSISVICTLLGLVGVADAVRDNLVRGLAVGLTINVGYVLAAIAVGFWLSDNAQETQVYGVAGVAALAGALVTVASLNSLGGDELNRLLSLAGAILTPIAYVLFAVYSYRTASQWQMFGIVLFIASGVLSALQAIPNVNQWTQGTRLTEVTMTITLWAITATVLAIISRVSAEQGKVSSVAFWLAAVGIALGGVALAGAGLVQTYMERILSIGYLETQVYLVPLYAFWIIGLLITAAGLALYALRHFFIAPSFEKIDQHDS